MSIHNIKALLDKFKEAQDEELTPYRRGYLAGQRGTSYMHCPYSPTHHKEDYQQWISGHADGVRDQRIGGYCGGSGDYLMQARLQ